MPVFAHNLLIAGVCEQFLKATKALAVCGIPHTHNGLLKTVTVHKYDYHIITYEVSYENL